MIDPATSWFEIVELPVTEFNSVTPMGKKGPKGRDRHNKPKEACFDKSSAQVGSLPLPTLSSNHLRQRKQVQAQFQTLCDSYGIKRKPASIKNPQTNAIPERMHQVIMTMLRTAELDMTNTVVPSDIADFLTDAAWA
eukprot:CCRYP_009013-RA/>CCRYP_009013-RA protein AED:0.40 eAED:0.64 QI:0/0/0/1/0/0/2/0/136